MDALLMFGCACFIYALVFAYLIKRLLNNFEWNEGFFETAFISLVAVAVNMFLITRFRGFEWLLYALIGVFAELAYIVITAVAFFAWVDRGASSVHNSIKSEVKYHRERKQERAQEIGNKIYFFFKQFPMNEEDIIIFFQKYGQDIGVKYETSDGEIALTVFQKSKQGAILLKAKKIEDSKEEILKKFEPKENENDLCAHLVSQTDYYSLVIPMNEEAIKLMYVFALFLYEKTKCVIFDVTKNDYYLQDDVMDKVLNF